jgi:hypothetical protein
MIHIEKFLVIKLYSLGRSLRGGTHEDVLVTREYSQFFMTELQS